MTIASGVSVVVISLVLPFVVSLCQRESWSSRAKEWAAVAVCAVAGVAYVVQSGEPLSDVPSVAVTFVGGCQASYLLFTAVGIKSKLLDALSAVHVTVSSDDGAGASSDVATTSDSATASGQAA